MKLPLIDLSSASAQVVTSALRKNGIIAVSGHGIDVGLIEKKQQCDECLFTLSNLEEYATNTVGGYFRSPSKNDTRRVWQVLPSSNFAPKGMPDFLLISLQLLDEYKKLFYKILGCIEEASQNLWSYADASTPVLRSWECFAKADIPNPPKFRVLEHCDSGLLTILPVPKEPGYQACIRRRWTSIFVEDFPPHTLLIHGGWALWDIARITPCMHRVRWTKNKRISSLFSTIIR